MWIMIIQVMKYLFNGFTGVRHNKVNIYLLDQHIIKD